MLIIVEQPETKRLYAVSDFGCYTFDGTPVSLDTTGWRVIASNVPTVADLALLRGRRRAVIAATSGAGEAVEATVDSESWVDTGYIPQH